MTKSTSVILIDDDPFTMAMTKRVVNKIVANDRIKTFCSAEDTLKYLQTENELPADDPSDHCIILSDLHMPCMDGFQFLDEFAKLSWAARSRYSVFILSSSTDENERSRLFGKSSFAGFCSKPLTPKKFEDLMGRTYSKPANGLKFTLSAGKVNLILEHGTPQGVYIHVRDTGMDVSPELSPVIFERFYQMDQPAATIYVESPPPESCRTAFTVWLPYRQASHTAAATEIEGTETPDTGLLPVEERPTILLVEDNRELAGFIANCFASSYEVIYASDGEKGLERATALLPDLIISDVVMPSMNGVELCIKIKNNADTNHIPVILLTAKAGLDRRLEGLASGADDYITKPFLVQELQLRVSNLLRRQQLLRDKICREMGKLPVPGEENKGNCDAFANEFLHRIYELVGENLDDPGFGVEELATQIGMSRANLHRKVKTLVGLPTGDLIRNYRLKRAVEYLKQGFNSSETAYKVGFGSPAYFSKCFRELYQVSPLEFNRRENG